MYEFNLGDDVKLKQSKDVIGEVVGRAEYLTHRSYQVRYQDKDGYPKEDWFSSGALEGFAK